MYVSDWAKAHMDDEAIDADFRPDTGEIEPSMVPPSALRVARVLERCVRYSETLIAWGWALGWAILFVPCSAVVIVFITMGHPAVAMLFSVGSVITGWPLFALLRKGWRILRTPML